MDSDSAPQLRPRLRRPSPAACCAFVVFAVAASAQQTAARPVAAPAAAAKSSAPVAQPAAVPAPRCALAFRDVTVESGLGDFAQESGGSEKLLILESIGAGVAFLDYDQDGDHDVWLTNGGRFEVIADKPAPRDELFENTGSTPRFRAVGKQLGADDVNWTMGIAVADVDADGFEDVYLTQWGPNTLLLNRAGKGFAPADPAHGAADPEWSTGACFFDADRDGDLDLYVGNYVHFDPEFVRKKPMTKYKDVSVYAGPRGLDPAQDTYWTNEGAGRFTEATAAAGIAGHKGFAFQIVPLDVDQDGWLDLFVANDSVANRLWINLRDGKFREDALRSGVALSKFGMAQAGMGVALGDVNGDARLDLFLSTFTDDSSTLFRNEGRGLFRDVSQASGLAQATTARLGWGALIADLDGDADAEILQVNGHVYPQVDRVPFGFRYRQPPQLFENRGKCRFADVSSVVGGAFALPLAGRGLACGDADNDGDPDLLIGQLDGPPVLLSNESARARAALAVRIVGTRGPRDPIGARVLCNSPGQRELATWVRNQSFLSAHAAELWFTPAGDAERVELLVAWPGGACERYEVAARGRVTVREGEGAPATWPE